MRKIIFITLITSFNLSFSQGFKEKFGQDICECFSEKERIELNTLETCFTKHIAKYDSDIEKLIDKNSELSEYEQGEIIGKQLFDNLQSDLVHTCDSYFEFFNSMREKSINDMRQNYPQSKMDTLNKQISLNKTTALLWERGNGYFSRNELSKAKEDYEMCLEIDPNHLQSTFFLGWVYEREENYSKAIELYETVLNLTGQSQFKLIVEIAKRKSEI
jgi:tetratricopeptide (TPR) repeat protein